MPIVSGHRLSEIAKLLSSAVCCVVEVELRIVVEILVLAFVKLPVSGIVGISCRWNPGFTAGRGFNPAGGAPGGG
ncbi:hypothetical protein F511_06297 [Dorcoceras hygrometricum]|uniref:Uncharacterized protein n=1 Tax=Dorcoceras hygrometricum TaxID=472368 RepID=A0A2Z7ADN8_9LAMI|nr:hypothetical protein F511_06297 [Dorcoceras hygrometricum]